MKDDIINIIKRSGVELGAIKKGSGELFVTELYGEPKLMKLLAYDLSNILDESVTCLAAKGTGGMPLAPLISQLTGKPMTLYADKLKDTWGTQLTAYTPTNDDFVAILDDKINARKIKGIAKMIGVIMQTGAKVSGIYVIAKQDNLPEDISGVPYKYLIDIDNDLEGLL